MMTPNSCESIIRITEGNKNQILIRDYGMLLVAIVYSYAIFILHHSHNSMLKSYSVARGSLSNHEYTVYDDEFTFDLDIVLKFINS